MEETPRSSSSIVFLLTIVLLLLSNQPRSSDAACILRKNGALARCHYLEDVKVLATYELKSLKVLAVGRHLSSGVFGNLTSLRHLDLSNGKLKKVERGSFDRLQSLRTLDLSNNHLTHLGMGTLEGLKHLHVLNLSRNSLEHIPHDAVHMKALKFLDLSRNNLNCDCKTLKMRDVLLKRGVDTSKKTFCSGSHNLRGRPFVEPDAEAVCMFDEQDLDEGMQMDQPVGELLEGSGEGSGDAFDQIVIDDIPEDEENPEKQPSEVSNSTLTPIEVPLTPDTTSSADDGEIFFSEDPDKHSITSPASKLAETTTEALSNVPVVPAEPEEEKHKEWIEASGDDDREDAWNAEGSGLEGSGTGIVPPISWDTPEKEEVDHPDHEEEAIEETTTVQQPAQTSTTTEAGGIVDSIFGFFWGTTAAPPKESSTSKDLNLEEEQFIPASSSPETSEVEKETPATEGAVVPRIINSVDAEKNPDSIKPSVLDNSKLGKVQAEVPFDSTESPDASAAKQSKKGMGSYVVLAVLLGVLAALIGFAAYKGDFCKGGRKRNDRHPNGPDVENGTELKDLRKSLLDNSNSVQPKISSNGNKPETVPLVTSSEISADVKTEDEPTAKFVGTVNESSPDPIKPPRKSFSPNEVEGGQKNGTNGKILTVPELTAAEDASMQCPRLSATKDVLVNGKHRRDSLSSVGESPTSGSARLSNPRLSQGLPPPSPGAQRVKITLQENPDSVPKTPLLITRTKAGENLVKTP